MEAAASKLSRIKTIKSSLKRLACECGDRLLTFALNLGLPLVLSRNEQQRLGLHQLTRLILFYHFYLKISYLCPS